MTEAQQALDSATARYQEQRDMLLNASGEAEAIRMLDDLHNAVIDALKAAIGSLLDSETL